MKIVIRDINPILIDAINLILTEDDRRTIEAGVGNILAEKAVGIVSPANSFGFMDGGIDAHYLRHFGAELQDDVQEQIKSLPFRELPVGMAIAVPTGHASIPNLVVAPTMRVPSMIRDPNNVYLATRAAVALALVSEWETLLMPGMGTGAGRLPLPTAAKCIIAGVQHAITPPAFPETWQQASIAQAERCNIPLYMF